MKLNNVKESKTNPLPEAIFSFHWGAYILTPIWCLFHKSWIALASYILLLFLSVLIPATSLILLGLQIYIGFKAKAWGWKNRNWKNLDHYLKNQKRWSIIALLLFGIQILYFVFWLLGR